MNRSDPAGKKRAAQITVLAVMLLLLVLCIAMTEINEVFRNRDAFINSMIDIIGLSLLVLLYRFSTFASSGREKQIFHLLTVQVFIAVFFSTLGNTFYGKPDCVRQITVFSSLAYIFSGLFFLSSWLFQKQFHEPSAKTKTVTVVMGLFSAVYTAALTVNIFTPVAFAITGEGILDPGIADYFTVLHYLLCSGLLVFATVFSNLDPRRKRSFLSCALPLVLLAASFLYFLLVPIPDYDIYLPGMSDIAIILPLYVLFFNVHVEQEKKLILQEKEQTELRYAVMLSQIRPHFLYNSLSVIAALCEEDPPLAAKATVTFSNYLRENMNFADKSSPVSFSEELNHIKSYVELEQLRFPNRLKVEYDIRCTAFLVPALSVQPLVENAIKHGVCKQKAGGTVRVSSFEDANGYTITVSDDGVGFDPALLPDDGEQHIGIRSARYRIREMLGGSLEIESAPGRGTVITVKIPKGGKRDADLRR